MSSFSFPALGLDVDRGAIPPAEKDETEGEFGIEARAEFGECGEWPKAEVETEVARETMLHIGQPLLLGKAILFRGLSTFSESAS